MGRSLGILWAEQGHEVFFGGRTAKKGKDVADVAGQDTRWNQRWSSCVCWSAAIHSARVNPAEVLTEIKILDGKILIDCNNFDIPEGFAYAPIAQSLAENWQQKF